MILYSREFHDYIIDELELGKRVALCLDSENNIPELHFIGWFDHE